MGPSIDTRVPDKDDSTAPLIKEEHLNTVDADSLPTMTEAADATNNFPLKPHEGAYLDAICAEHPHLSSQPRLYERPQSIYRITSWGLRFSGGHTRLVYGWLAPTCGGGEEG